MAARAAGVVTAIRHFVLIALAVSACTTAPSDLTGFPGTEPQIRAFYEARAFERGATCPQPFIRDITRTEEVSDDGRLLVLRVDYAFDIRLRSSRFGNRCQGFGSRLFTFERVDGELRIREMSGEQRAR
jgi:hypothetical protein